MLVRQWYRIAASFDPAAGKVTLIQEPLRRYPTIDDADQVEADLSPAPTPLATPLLLAGSPAGAGTVGRHFDGKIDSPAVVAGSHGLSRYLALLGANAPFVHDQDVIARWDFSRRCAPPAPSTSARPAATAC